MEVPLPWERLLWKHRSWWPHRASCTLTDFRVVSETRDGCHELAIQDIADVQRQRGWVDRLLGTSTLILLPRRRQLSPLVISRVRHGSQLAALIELLAEDPSAAPDAGTVRDVLSWRPRVDRRPAEFLAVAVVVLAAVSTVVIGLHGEAPDIAYPPNDAIYPGGVKKDRDAIAEFMESEVLPWARVTLGPIKGGADKISCETCHGADREARGWKMPSVVALPEPLVGSYASETLGVVVDAQMRNAMYGYLAEPDKQTTAAYMRQVVVPGMARLLGRPPYDFTKTYEYNRTRFAIGCYHCHRVTGKS
jgi:hypothetical protein